MLCTRNSYTRNELMPEPSYEIQVLKREGVSHMEAEVSCTIRDICQKQGDRKTTRRTEMKRNYWAEFMFRQYWATYVGCSCKGWAVCGSSTTHARLEVTIDMKFTDALDATSQRCRGKKKVNKENQKFKCQFVYIYFLPKFMFFLTSYVHVSVIN